MPVIPPSHPDIRRQLRARLHDLSPRAFELFAGDLLVYIGLQNVEVTRFVGDGGIDAHGEIVAASELACVSTGVQVKRHRNNVQRSDIDRFIGALAGHFHHGIFVTTAGYAEQARVKARSSPVVRIDPVDGDQVVGLMLRHRLGLVEPSGIETRLDENYFVTFEEQAVLPKVTHPLPAIAESSVAASNYLVSPEDDLISLRAMSYALRVDTTTIRHWIERGKLIPDHQYSEGRREGFFFRRNRLETVRRDLVRTGEPRTSTEWRQEFLDFAGNRNLTKSYKPVLLRAILRLVDRNGAVPLDDLVREFHAFYLQRDRDGRPAEFGVSLLAAPAAASHEAIRQLVLKYPLDRFIIKGFLEYVAGEGVIRFAPQLWSELRFYDVQDIQNRVEQQLAYYYNRGSAR